MVYLFGVRKFIYRKELVKSPESEQSIAKLDEKKAIQDKILLIKRYFYYKINKFYGLKEINYEET